MKIGIFGGAFDPVHRGHTALAESCVRDVLLDLLILVPTASPPHRDLPAVASKYDRVQMLKAAFAGFDNVRISDIEFKRRTKSYTYDTVCELKKRFEAEFPHESVELYLIIGADEFMNFHKWYKYRELLSMVTLYTSRRAGVMKKDMLSYASAALSGGKFIISENGAIPASSTEIREKIHNKQDFSDFLDNKVYNYIESKGTYDV